MCRPAGGGGGGEEGGHSVRGLAVAWGPAASYYLPLGLLDEPGGGGGGDSGGGGGDCRDLLAAILSDGTTEKVPPRRGVPKAGVPGQASP